MPNIIQGGLGRHYTYSRHGQLWMVTPVAANPATTFTGQTSWVATTPTFLIRKAAASPATRTILKRIRLSQDGTVAGSDITIAIMIDTTDRYSAAGTLIAQAQPSMAQNETSSFTVRANATASAASANVRTIDTVKIDASLGAVFEYDTEGQIMIAETGSILIYTYATATGPTWIPSFELIEEPI